MSETGLPEGTVTIHAYGLRTTLAPGERLDIFRDDGSRIGTLVYGTPDEIAAAERRLASIPAEPEQADEGEHIHEWRLDVTAGTRYCGCGEVEPTGNPTAVDAAAWRESEKQLIASQLRAGMDSHEVMEGVRLRARLAPARDDTSGPA